jgi:hypothetical protein
MVRVLGARSAVVPVERTSAPRGGTAWVSGQLMDAPDGGYVA